MLLLGLAQIGVSLGHDVTMLLLRPALARPRRGEPQTSAPRQPPPPRSLGAGLPLPSGVRVELLPAPGVVAPGAPAAAARSHALLRWLTAARPAADASQSRSWREPAARCDVAHFVDVTALCATLDATLLRATHDAMAADRRLRPGAMPGARLARARGSSR